MWRKIWRSKFLLIWLFALGVRVYLSFLPAQPYDIGTYQAWGQIFLSQGPSQFFTSTWCDYLPLPVFIFAGLSWLSSVLSLSFPLLFKLVFSLLELGLLTFLLRLIRPLFRFPFSFAFVSSLFLFSPVLLADTAWWGQTDSLPALLAALSLFYFFQYSSSRLLKPLLLSASLFALALAFKPITLLLIVPLIIFGFFSSRRLPFFPLIFSALLAFIIFLLPAFPIVGPLNSLNFLWRKALEQANTYPYLSINAFNLWTLHSSLSSWPSDQRVVLGFSAQTWGLGLFSLLTFSLFFHWRRARWDRKHLFRVAATMFITFYAVTTRMHERYLLFGLPLLTLAGLYQPWLFLPLTLLSLLFTFNLWAAFTWVLHQQIWPVSVFWIQLSSWAIVLLGLGLSLIWNWPKTFQRFRSWVAAHRLLFFILLFALALRLFSLGSPRQYIFDEVYHAFTAREYLANHPAAWEWWTTPPPGVAYEWTHPPLAKYGMVLGMALVGESAFGWRLLSAFMGVFGIYGVFRLTLALFHRRRPALLAALLLSLEGLYLVQSRIGMNDIYLVAFLVWSLVLAVKGDWKKAAVFFGLALASKWSALFLLLPLTALYLHSQLGHFSFSSFFHHLGFIARLLLISFLTYLLTFAPFLLSGHSFPQLLELHRQMWFYHTHLVATHAYQSSPWQWIFSLRPVWYFVHYDVRVSNLYAQSNPLILWFGFAALLTSLRRLRRFPYFVLILAYLSFLVPWLFSPRIMFFYHYLPSSVFLVILLAVRISSFSKRSTAFLLLLFSLVFLLLFPLYYGFPMPSHYWDVLFTVFPTWK